MNVDLMRKVDYYAGVPLCFLATFIVKVSNLFIPVCKPNRVLLVELSEMGSAIIVDPAMQKLKNVAGAELFFVIFDKNKPSLKLLNSVEDQNIFTIRETGIVPLAIDTLKFFWWCRQRKIDSVIDLELFSRYSALLTGLSGANRRLRVLVVTGNRCWDCVVARHCFTVFARRPSARMSRATRCAPTRWPCFIRASQIRGLP